MEYDAGHYDLSRLYAKKCIKEAQTIDNHKWVFNSTMETVKSNMAEHNKSDAKNDLAAAKACAQHLQDADKVHYIELCQDVIEALQFDDLFGAKQLEKRENKIIQMMADQKMKDEVAHLFRQMAAMPPTRRMTVMPGVRVEKEKGKTSARKRTMSIMPVKETTRNSGMSDLINLTL